MKTITKNLTPKKFIKLLESKPDEIISAQIVPAKLGSRKLGSIKIRQAEKIDKKIDMLLSRVLIEQPHLSPDGSLQWVMRELSGRRRTQYRGNPVRPMRTTRLRLGRAMREK